MATKRINKKSVKLTEDQVLALRDFVAGFPAKIDAALKIKIPLSTLDRIMLAGSGSPENIKKVVRKLPSAQAA